MANWTQVENCQSSPERLYVLKCMCAFRVAELESSRADYFHSDLQGLLQTSVHGSCIKADVRAFFCFFYFAAKMEDQAALKSSLHMTQIKGYKFVRCHKHLNEEPPDLKKNK